MRNELSFICDAGSPKLTESRLGFSLLVMTEDRLHPAGRLLPPAVPALVCLPASYSFTMEFGDRWNVAAVPAPVCPLLSTLPILSSRSSTKFSSVAEGTSAAAATSIPAAVPTGATDSSPLAVKFSDQINTQVAEQLNR